MDNEFECYLSRLINLEKNIKNPYKKIDISQIAIRLNDKVLMVKPSMAFDDERK